MALSHEEILNIVGQELTDSIGGSENDSVDGDREQALATYLGQPNGKEVEGRSAIVSTDVADAIEWIMPEIVKAFTQNNEVVTFDPVYEGDEEQAELESQYVYDILMKDNEGFMVIHQTAKDALMQKNGFIKTWYDKNDKERTQEYTGMTENELGALTTVPDTELISITEHPAEDGSVPTFDASVKIMDRNSKVSVVSVPPEEFRVNRMHNSIILNDARFTAHVMQKVASDAVEMGMKKDDVDEIPSSEEMYDDGDYRFYMQGENTSYENNSGDPSQRPIEITECFMYLDINEDGIAEYVKITVAGGDNPTHLISVESISSCPFVSYTAILMSHKVLGLSIYDRLKQIQDQKTTLWRNIFDNMYLQNNQRTVVVENQVNLDDLMVSRPGGIIRAKRLDAVMPFPTPPLNGDAYKMMEYLDQVRAGRTGVSPEGAVQDSQIGDRIGSQGLDRMMNQKEELVGLMIRVMAEVCIKPLCYKIRDQVIAHQDVVRHYEHRGQWVPVEPKKWRNRSHTTVRVGTGSGNRKEQAATLTNLMTVQEKMLANPSQALVAPDQIFTLMDDYCKLSGFPSARRYFLDPKSPEGQKMQEGKDKQNQENKQKEDQMEAALAKAQITIAQAEQEKVKVAMANTQLKGQIDTQKNQLTLQQQTADAELKSVKLQLEEAIAMAKKDTEEGDLEYKYYQTDQNTMVELKRIVAQYKAQEENRESAEKIAKESSKDEDGNDEG